MLYNTVCSAILFRKEKFSIINTITISSKKVVRIGIREKQQQSFCRSALAGVAFFFFFTQHSSTAIAQTDSLSTISAIVVRGNSVTESYVIEREMSLQVGDVATTTALSKDRDQIYNLGLFNRVELTQSHDTLYVDVVERWYLFPIPLLGFRYNDFSKVYYGLGVTHQNFRGRNEKIMFTAGLGYDRWVGVDFYAPNITRRDDIFTSVSIVIQKLHNLSQTVGEYENTNFSFRWSLGKRIDFYQRFYGTIGYDLWKVDQPLSGRTLSPSGRDYTPMVAVSYRYDNRNNNEYTTEGTLLKCTIAKFGFSNKGVNVLTTEYDARHFISIGKYSGIGFRSAGSFLGGGAAPPYFHAFYGYAERIRGHYHQTFEGECRLSASAEVRLPILSPRHISFSFLQRTEFTQMRYGIYGALFADAGKIWYRTQRVDRRPLLAGYGAGIHFLLPYAVCIRTEIAVNERRQSEAYIAWDVSF